MAVTIVNFSAPVALAAIMRLARDASTNMYTVMKMLYVADKMHLKRTGRFMFGDWYASMDAGATPSGAYNLAKYCRGESQDMGFPEARDYLVLDPRTHQFTLLQDPAEEYLSDIAQECLETVVRDHIDNTRNLNYWYQQAHDAAWDSARERSDGETIEIESREIAETIPNNSELLAYLEAPA